ncbi:MAG: hypothetical protein Q8R08_03895 [bacterium]|nr:hypothetical protein [bacterium]
MVFQKKYIPLFVVAGIAVLFGILWYFQSQGVIKIFPSKEDRRIQKILTIDESKFTPAEGLPAETFDAEINKLYEQKEKVLENPQNAQLWFDFAYTKQFLNDHEGAILSWEKSLELQPLNFLTAGNLGNTYQYFLKNYDKAEFYYLEALKIRPNYTIAFQGLLDIYRYNVPEKQGQIEPLMQLAIKNDPANEAAYYYVLADFFLSQNDMTKGKEYYEIVKSLNPEGAIELEETYPQVKS